MSNSGVNNVKLGTFVLIGLLLLVGALYMIGRNQNLFGSRFILTAQFTQVNGLMAGNNVRFSGIDVGTVKKIEFLSDTLILVTMTVRKDVQSYIRKNAVVSVGSDGLMGNKLVNIQTMPGDSPSVEDGDNLATKRTVETERMMENLELTNANLLVITNDVAEITGKILESKHLWQLANDSLMANDLRRTLAGIRKSAEESVQITRHINALIAETGQGKGITGMLISDTTAARQLAESLCHLELASKQAGEVATNLRAITESIQKGEGALGKVVSDSTLAANLQQTIKNIEEGSAGFKDNMEALKHNFLLRGYFKKKAREEK
jgi:phospholipid/cholesterol/gamma-HCH transport system substrate-binding protein